MKTISVLFLYFGLFFQVFPAEGKPVPRSPAQYVYDESGEVRSLHEVSQFLSQWEKKSTQQVVIAVFQSLEGQDLVDYTHRVFQEWKIGQSGKDNGVLVAFYLQDRKIRIEVGYGLESVLTDAHSKRLIESQIIPAMRSGGVDLAVRTAAQALVLHLARDRNAEAVSVQTKRIRGPFPILLQLAILIGTLFLYFLIFRISRIMPPSGYHWGPTHSRRRSSGIYWGGSSPSGGGFGGGGFGGFSGGGGMSGGGGASGRW